MSKTELDKSFFVAFCIEQYKNHKGISGKEASDILFSAGIPQYLSDNYEVLHTQGSQWLLEEIEEQLDKQNN